MSACETVYVCTRVRPQIGKGNVREMSGPRADPGNTIHRGEIRGRWESEEERKRREKKRERSKERCYSP